MENFLFDSDFKQLITKIRTKTTGIYIYRHDKLIKKLSKYAFGSRVSHREIKIIGMFFLNTNNNVTFVFGCLVIAW